MIAKKNTERKLVGGITSLHLVEKPVTQEEPLPTQHGWDVVEKIMPVTNCGLQNEIISLLVNEGGTFLKVKNPKIPSAFQQKKISAIPIYPVAILSCYDNSHRDPEIYVELEVVSEQRRRMSVPLSALASLSSNKEAQAIIGRVGISCTRELGYGLHEVSMASWKAGVLEQRTGTGQTGWASQDSHVRPGSPAYVGTYPKTTEASGSFEVWRDAIVDLVKDSPVFATVLSFAVGSYCRGIPGITTDHSGILHIYSADSSRGKSFTQECCASLQASPNSTGNVMADSSSTLASTEILLSANNHGVMCLDEVHSLLAKDNKPVERLMLYANGGGRAKVVVRNGGHGLATGIVWNTTIISSGNCNLESVYLGHHQAEAIRARIIEIDAEHTPIFGFTDFVRINKARAVVSGNYGHAYPLITEYISTNRAKVISLVREFESIATSIAGEAMGGTLGRRVQSCALAYAGAHILSEILGVTISTDPIVSLFSSEAVLAEETVEHAVQAVRDDLLSIIRTFMGTFIINGYLAVDEADAINEDNESMHWAESNQKERSVTHNNNVSRRTTSNGVIVQKKPMSEALDFTECQIYISTHGKDSFRNFDVNAMAYLARSQGWLIQNGSSSQQKKSTVTMNKKGLGRCYGFDLEKAKKILDESDRLDNLGADDDVWPDIPF
jgi:hypothetical protein